MLDFCSDSKEDRVSGGGDVFEAEPECCWKAKLELIEEAEEGRACLRNERKNSIK